MAIPIHLELKLRMCGVLPPLILNLYDRVLRYRYNYTFVYSGHRYISQVKLSDARVTSGISCFKSDSTERLAPSI
jgi:hypothetical protein